MIEQIQLIRNVGLFDNYSPSHGPGFTPLTLVYGENARGKTTLAAILRSLATNKPELVLERRRLGSQHPPHVVLKHGGGQSVLQNDVWSNHLPNVAVFDDAFVAANVCSGVELQTTHRQNLHELILGQQGVTLNALLQQHVAAIEQHNVRMRELADDISPKALGPFKVDAFCKLKKAPDSEQKIEDAKRRLAAAKASDQIRQKPGFQSFALPDFDVEAINDVLGRTLTSLEANAAARVRSHMAGLGDGGEAWISDGMQRIPAAAAGETGEICPFCAQDLENSSLIDHYRAYFSEAYTNLKSEIRQTEIGVRDAHSGDVPSAFERSVRTAIQCHEFWKSFAELPEISIDTAAIARDWNAAREAVLSLLRSKAAAPLESMLLSSDALASIQTYRRHLQSVDELSEKLIAANAELELVKEQATADDLSALGNDLENLQAQVRRFEPEVVVKCDAYLAEKEAKKKTETLRKEARTQLDTYRDEIFPAFEEAINNYLQRFGASFRLGAVKSVNNRGGSSASYCMIINQQNVDITADEGPSFKNTLSAGDRNTLALAWFFASLDQDANLANKIIIIDDPMTSLDDHRTLRTRQEIMALAARVNQIIVLSHSKPFLCGLYDASDKNTTTPLRIHRGGSGSEICEWDVRNDSISEHDKRHELVRKYINVADPDKEREVAQALRHILEAFMRVAYPEHFPPGKLLGPFINICEQRVGTDGEVLSTSDITTLKALLEYANRFHHDSNPAWQTEIINDTELTDFSQQTLLFASRR